MAGKIVGCIWKSNLEKQQASTLARIASLAGLLTEEDIALAVELSSMRKLPLDQILLTSGFLHDEIANICSRAVVFVEDGICIEVLAVQGLLMAIKKHLSFEDGLRYYGWGW